MVKLKEIFNTLILQSVLLQMYTIGTRVLLTQINYILLCSYESQSQQS